MFERIKKLITSKGDGAVSSPRLSELTILLFIGSPRTGSTMLGQIMNHHPQCLIASEASLVSRCVFSHEPLDDIVPDVVRSAREAYDLGLENTAKYVGTISAYQEKWQSFLSLKQDPSFVKRGIRVIGDKKAGGAAKCIIAKREAVIAMFNQHKNIHLLQILRNPVDAGVSLMASHHIERFEDACRETVALSHAAAQVGRQFEGRYHCIRYEELVRSPARVLIGILAFLGLDQDAAWIEKIATRISIDAAQHGAAHAQYHDIATQIIREEGAESTYASYAA